VLAQLDKISSWLAVILILAIAYIVIAIGRLAGFRVDRAGAAIIGASLIVAVNALSLDETYRAINFDTIILLFGMMLCGCEPATLRILQPGGGTRGRKRSQSDVAAGFDRGRGWRASC